MSEITVRGCDCVSNATVYGLQEAIRRAKFPMAIDTNELTDQLTPGILALAKSGKGSGHDQWLTGVVVQFDLTFSIKAWTEAERYKFLDFISSQSTMHRITRFNLDLSYDRHTDKRIIQIMKEKVNEYNMMLEEKERSGLYFQDEIDDKYLEILYSNPAGFRLTAGMTTNYRQLKTIYSQRKAHRLEEWREFCKWIETLPMAEFITGGAGAE